MLSYAAFYAPGKGPYLETYLSVIGNSVVYVKNQNGKYQGSVQVSMIFKKGEEIKFADKYNLLSQEMDDSTKTDVNFLDQQRIPLPDGEYTFELSIADKNSADAPFLNSQKVTISYPTDKINISSIQLLESIKQSDKNSQLTKNGFDLVPFVNNYFGPAIKSLQFYAEIYNTPKILQNDLFLLSYYIEDYETKVTLEKYKVFSKQQPKEVNVVMTQLNIEGLPSGNYNLVVEVRNNKNDLLAMKETFFQRHSNIATVASADPMNADISNTFVAALIDSAKLKECIYSFRPIANSSENNFEDFQLKRATLPTMQRYVYSFWKSRDSNDPEGAFRKYMEQVENVNVSYKTPINKGYETDRGRVYLQYGQPNEIIKEDREPGTYPYEIWHYYKIESQSNRKFVFYNRDLVSNDYRLLHSDMPGENFEPSWQEVLHRRNAKVNPDVNAPRSRNFGDKSQDNYGNSNKSDYPR